MAPAGAAARPGPEAIAIGALLWDVIATATAEGPFAPGDDVPGRVVCRPGGVALNLALALQRAGIATAILAQVGADAAGRALLRAVARQGVATHGIDPLPGVATGRYVAIEAGGRLIGAVAATALEDGRLASPSAPWRGLAVIDGNLSAPLLAEIAAGGLLAQADLRLCVPSPAKARRLAPLARLAGATLYLNRAEAEAFCAAPLADARRAAAALIGAGVARVLVTDGAAPAAFATAGGQILTATPAAVPVRRVP
ncbi:MAG: PfkB family carbohydrate kinase, partial [Gemmobacter sp.]